MTKTALLPKIDKLTPEMLEDVSKFIDYLLFINANNSTTASNSKPNGFGIVKGKIEITDDFDEPIDEIFEVLK